jgi:GTP-binding protein
MKASRFVLKPMNDIPNLQELKDLISKFHNFQSSMKDEINFVFNENKLKLIKSIRELSDVKKNTFPLPMIGFIGRSNVGKSSLINTILNRRNCLKISSKPGETKKIEQWRIGKYLILVDFPGYGFAFEKEEKIIKWKEVMKFYLKETNHRVIFLLIDSRHGLKKSDFEMLDFLKEFNIKFKIILTKCDLISFKVLSKVSNKLKSDLVEHKDFKFSEDIFILSSLENSGIEYLQHEIIQHYSTFNLEKYKTNIKKNVIRFL